MEIADGLKVPVIAGIIPLKSARMADFMNNNVPGINVTTDIMERMETAEEPVEEGLKIAAESIRELKGLCRGVHIMPIGKHTNTARLLEMAGIGKNNL